MALGPMCPPMWADVREEIAVDDEGDGGEACALCCIKKALLLAVQCLWEGAMFTRVLYPRVCSPEGALWEGVKAKPFEVNPP